METFCFWAFLTFAMFFPVALVMGAIDSANPKRIRERKWKAERQLRKSQRELEDTKRKLAEAEARYAEVRKETHQSRLDLVSILKRKYRICRWFFADETM